VVGVSRVKRLAPTLGLAPFLLYLTVFLLVPTLTVVVQAFIVDGRFSTENLSAIFDGIALTSLGHSLEVSAGTAVIGAFLGALLAYLIVSLPPGNLVRRAVTSFCGVLAQFGGVTLAFAFIATVGFSGVLTLAIQDLIGVNIASSGWLYEIPGLMLVYLYFQIPLMVIVFLPALEGVRPQWREAATNLGATTFQYWTRVAVPLLTPAFLGSALLLFANAFAAYATAAALITQGNPILPLLIRTALTSEVVLGHQGLAFALALEMIVVVAVVMALYGLLLRRTARWMK
jgi:putative spermidine/putrescine transport system permease protein